MGAIFPAESLPTEEIVSEVSREVKTRRVERAETDVGVDGSNAEWTAAGGKWGTEHRGIGERETRG